MDAWVQKPFEWGYSTQYEQHCRNKYDLIDWTVKPFSLNGKQSREQKLAKYRKFCLFYFGTNLWLEVFVHDCNFTFIAFDFFFFFANLAWFCNFEITFTWLRFSFFCFHALLTTLEIQIGFSLRKSHLQCTKVHRIMFKMKGVKPARPQMSVKCHDKTTKSGRFWCVYVPSFQFSHHL